MASPAVDIDIRLREAVFNHLVVIAEVLLLSDKRSSCVGQVKACRVDGEAEVLLLRDVLADRAQTTAIVIV